jgi:hypothetical protein
MQEKVVAREWGDLLGLSKFQLNLIKAEQAGRKEGVRQ